MGCCGDCCLPYKEKREPIRYDPDFNGPIRNRSCTDVFWLIFFIVFLGGWGYVGFFSIHNGNVEKLLAPIDSRGNRCGLDAPVLNKKYLVFFDILKCLKPGAAIVGCPTPQVCVEKCPTETRQLRLEIASNNALFDQLRTKMVCIDGINVQSLTATEALKHIEDGKCADYILQSQPVLYRCIGDLSTLQCKDNNPSSKGTSSDETCVRNPKEAQKSLLNSATAVDSYVGWIVASWFTYFSGTENERATYILSSQIVHDLVESRWYMAGALVVVVLICFVYIVLLRWVITPVVWLSIVGLLGLLSFCIYLCYNSYIYYRANPVTLGQTTNVLGLFKSYLTDKTTWLVLMIIISIIVVVLFVIVVFLRSRITIAIALIKEGSKAIGDVKSSILFPIFPWLLQCCVIGYAVTVLVFLMSIGDPAFKVVNLKNDTECDCKGVYTEDYVPCNPLTFFESCHPRGSLIGSCSQATCHFADINNPQSVTYLHLVNLLGFFWAMFFISGAGDMMLASTFSTWYWTRKKSNLPFFTLTSGICRTLCNHLGTVAFGSLIIAICRVIRVLLEYIDHKVKKFDNPISRAILCCCKCCFWCLESFLKFINKNAYIMCAVHGKNFCSSARDAFSLLMRNIVRVVVLDKVMDFLFFLSKCLISIGMGVAFYYFLQWSHQITNGEQLHYYYIPAIIIGLCAFLISSIFFSVYEMAVDTLFLCFLEDCERNDGSPEKQYFMSKNLMNILGKKNKMA